MASLKRWIIVLVLILILIVITPALFAREQGGRFAVTYWSYCGGIEFNRFSQDTNPALGINLNFSPLENRYALFSVRATVVNNFSGAGGGDVAWRFAFPFLNRTKVQLLVGIEQGISYINIKDSKEVWTATINGMLSSRIFLGKQFFIEPYGRFGYPVFFAGGILAGMRYNYK
jgi:hypothetical protein